MASDFDTISEDILPAERRQRLLEWLQMNMSGSNHELARIFSTSVSTIRRDLDSLAGEGLVRRTHGGAVSIRRRANWEPSSEQARQTAIEEKRAIAIEAARRLEPEHTIMIDTGSTPHEFAKVVAELSIPLTVVTADVFVASVLANRPHVQLIVTGGVCRPGAFTLLGEPGLSFLRDLHCDKLFLCSQAVDPVCVSDTSADLVNLKRAMIAAARSTILLVDSSKFASRAIYRVTEIETIDEIITDDGISPEHQAQMLASGVTLTTVSVGSGEDGDS